MSSLVNMENLRMVAAGSGSAVLEQAPSILREAVELSGAEKPKVLTIGTAEPTVDWYNEFIQGTKRQFGKIIGAEITNLHEFNQAP